MRYTYEQIADVEPCWLNNGRANELRRRVGKGVTPIQIAKSVDVSIADRRWLLTRLAIRLPDGQKLLVLWAAGCAQDVRYRLSGDAQDCADCAIQTAVAWTQGVATQEDCRDAAYAAYADAASYAAYDVYAAAYAYADAAAANAAEKQLITLAQMMEAECVR